MKVALAGTGRVSLMASEEEDEPVSVQSACGREGGSYVAVFDPLDGSRNIDASIPTGTIFGLYATETSASRASDATFQAVMTLFHRRSSNFQVGTRAPVRLSNSLVSTTAALHTTYQLCCQAGSTEEAHSVLTNHQQRQSLACTLHWRRWF